MDAALYLSSEKRADENGHADVLGDRGGDSGAPHAQVQPEDQEHIPEDVEDAAGSQSQHGEKCLALIPENVVHDTAGGHGRSRNKDPGTVLDGVGQNRIRAAQKPHEGCVK